MAIPFCEHQFEKRFQDFISFTCRPADHEQAFIPHDLSCRTTCRVIARVKLPQHLRIEECRQQSLLDARPHSRPRLQSQFTQPQKRSLGGELVGLRRCAENAVPRSVELLRRSQCLRLRQPGNFHAQMGGLYEGIIPPQDVAHEAVADDRPGGLIECA